MFKENAILFLEVFDDRLLVLAHPAGDSDEEELELRRHRVENLSEVPSAQSSIWSRLSFLVVQPSYPWTRKVKGKTICVALSKEQYDWLKEAIANWRQVQETLRQMQRLSREELFESLPNPRRRKQLGKKILGLV